MNIWTILLNRDEIRTKVFPIRIRHLSLFPLISMFLKNPHKKLGIIAVDISFKNENKDMEDNRDNSSLLESPTDMFIPQIKDKNRDKTFKNKTKTVNAMKNLKKKSRKEKSYQSHLPLSFRKSLT